MYPLPLTLTQIVMLESSTDLFHYLQASQITRDLGGTLDYDHDQWIQIQRVGSIFIHSPSTSPSTPTTTSIERINKSTNKLANASILFEWLNIV